MALSQDLISEFSKIVNEDNSKKTEETVIGTVKVIDGKEYVQIDGSDIWTPVTSTVEIQNGDRVSALIKNHTATVTGNITSPSANTKTVKNLKDEVDEHGNTIKQIDNTITQQNNSIIQMNNSIKQQNDTINSFGNTIDSQNNKIQEFNNTIIEQNNTITSMNNVVTEQSNQITSINNTITEQGNTITSINNTVTQQGNTISQQGNVISQQGNTIKEQGDTITSINNTVTTQGNDIKAVNSDIEILNSGFKIEDGKLTGLSEIVIDDLVADEVLTNSLDAKYANIDFANIEMAAVEKLFTDSGIIKDLIVSEGKITGELVGVTIKGDLIEGNTVKADKLVVKGSDGLYYKLNVSGETVETQQTNENSLNGSIITAKSITATKIQVDDLVAFGATIGGFHIDDHAIYSGAKNSINNTTAGLFLDDTGQFYLGDSNNRIRFYKAADDGKWKLDITANEIRLGSSGKTIEEALEEIELTPGPAGPQGEKGEKGDKGDTGVAGAQGPQGEKGEDAPIPITEKEASGTIISVDDASNNNLISFIGHGYSEQEIRSGKNLYNSATITSVSNGTNNNGVITSNTFSTKIINLTPYNIVDLEAGTYYFSADIRIISGTATLNKINDNITDATVVSNPTLSTTKQRYVYKKTYTSAIQLTQMLFQFSASANAVVEVSNIMISKENTSYEKYGASPSPDYPSEIKSVEGIRNLFDSLKGTSTTKNGMTITCNENSIILNGTTTAITNFWFDNLNIPLKKGAISFLTNVNLSGKGAYVWKENSTNILQTNNSANITIESDKTITQFLIQINSGVTFNNQEFKILLAEGNVSTYVPYGSWLRVKDVGKNLYNISDVRERSANYFSIDDEDWITMTKDNSSNTSLVYINNYLNPSKNLKPDTTYYIVFEVKSVSGNGAIHVTSLHDTGNKGQFTSNNAFKFEDLKAGDVKKFSVKTINDFTNCITMLRQFHTISAGQSGSITYRVSVFEYEADADNFVYEKYNENIVLIDMNKPNLFDGNKYTYSTGYNGSVSNISTNEIEVTLRTSWSRAIMKMVDLIPNTEYIIKAYLDKSNYSTETASGFYNDNDYRNNAFTKTSGNVYFKFTSDDNGEYSIQLYGNYSGDNYSGTIVYKDIKLYEGTEIDDYYKLAKMGDIEDQLIIDEDGSTKIEKRIREIVLDGSESWNIQTNTEYTRFMYYVPGGLPTTRRNEITSTHFTYMSSGHNVGGAFEYDKQIFIYPNEDITTIEQLKTWLSENKPIIQYELAEPEIIDLGRNKVIFYKGVNNLSTETNMDLLETDISYYTEFKGPQGDISALEEDIEERFDEINTTVETAQSDIIKLQHMIANLVTDQNGGSLMTQTSDGWTFNMSSINNNLNTINQYMADTDTYKNNNDSIRKQLSDLINDVAKNTAYITMETDEYGAPCIELGRTETELLGGRNLIPNSTWVADTDLTSNAWGKIAAKVYVTPGKTYTFSSYYKGEIITNTDHGYGYAYAYDADGARVGTGDYFYNGAGSQTKTINSNISYLICNLGPKNCTKGDLYAIKLEEGSKATDWLPAPEDYNADFKVRITNEAINFMEGTTRIAYASNNTFYVEKMIAKNELQIGEGPGFVWKTRSNGNMGLTYISG